MFIAIIKTLKLAAHWQSQTTDRLLGKWQFKSGHRTNRPSTAIDSCSLTQKSENLLITGLNGFA